MNLRLPSRILRRCAALLSACAATLLLTHCGGVGQDGTGSTPDSLTTGVVNGFGSVIVNGIHFDVRAADISIDGSRGRTQADLRVGMVVSVTGKVDDNGNTGTANRLVYESLLRGTVEDLPGGRTLRVLGQRVAMDDTTLFEGASSSDDINNGDHVQVSGFREPDGSLHASWVSRSSSDNEQQLLDFITSVGSGGNTVLLSNGLSINLASAVLDGVTLSTLAPRQLVRITLQAPASSGTATATRLRLVDTREQDSLPRQQRQGIVAQWDAATASFMLNGQPVHVTGSTQYQDGSAASLGDGARVEVTGTLASDRVLQAERVRFFTAAPTGYVRGPVTSIDVSGSRFYVLVSTGASVEVHLRDRTLLNDTSAGTTLSLSNLATGNDVLVLGQADGNRIEADLVNRIASVSPGRGVGGLAKNINPTTRSFDLLGMHVVANINANYFDASGAAMTQNAFFTGLQPDDLLRAEGLASASGINAFTVRRVRN